MRLKHTRNLELHVLNTHDSKDPGLASGVLAGPGKVTSLKTERAEFEVASPDTHRVDTFGTKLGVGGLTTELELSLLAVVGALSTGSRTFVPGGTGDTCNSTHSTDQTTTTGTSTTKKIAKRGPISIYVASTSSK